MNKKKFQKSLEEFLENNEVSDSVHMVIDNALQMLKDDRLDKEEAQKYIAYWFKKLKYNKHIFTESEEKFFKSHTASNLGIWDSLAYSISRMFR